MKNIAKIIVFFLSPLVFHTPAFAGSKDCTAHKIKLIRSFFFIFFVGSSSVVFAGDLQDGIDAYKNKDYKTAYKLWLPLAGQGDANLQFMLGMMHSRGTGEVSL